MNHDSQFRANRLAGLSLQAQRSSLDPILSEAGIPIAVLIRDVLVERIRDVVGAVEAPGQ